MNDRIRQLRKKLNLTQAAFGARIGVKQTSIAGYENGSRVPLDTVISSICKEYSVSESWLRTGEGEMFIPQTRNDEISAFMGDILRDKPDFRQKFISVLARMTPEEWAILEKKVLELADEIKEAGP